MSRIEWLLRNCTTPNGALDPATKAKFRAYFVNPTPETWDAIFNEPFIWYGVGIPPGRPWDLLTIKHKRYYAYLSSGKKGVNRWASVPDVFAVYQVMTDATKAHYQQQLLDNDW